MLCVFSCEMSSLESEGGGGGGGVCYIVFAREGRVAYFNM